MDSIAKAGCSLTTIPIRSRMPISSYRRVSTSSVNTTWATSGSMIFVSNAICIGDAREALHDARKIIVRHLASEHTCHRALGPRNCWSGVPVIARI